MEFTCMDAYEHSRRLQHYISAFRGGGGGFSPPMIAVAPPEIYEPVNYLITCTHMMKIKKSIKKSKIESKSSFKVLNLFSVHFPNQKENS